MRHNSLSLESTLHRAKRRAERDGRLRFVYLSGNRFSISTRRPRDCDCYWSDGLECGRWYRGDSSAVADPTLTREIGYNLDA